MTPKYPGLNEKSAVVLIIVMQNAPQLLAASTSAESLEICSSVEIPPVYHEVFSKAMATGLLPHMPSTPSKSNIPYPPQQTRPLKSRYRKPSDRTIQDYIRPSTSPASAEFFFKEKKWSRLRPCTQYKGLNQISQVSLCAASGPPQPFNN